LEGVKTKEKGNGGEEYIFLSLLMLVNKRDQEKEKGKRGHKERTEPEK